MKLATVRRAGWRCVVAMVTLAALAGCGPGHREVPEVGQGAAEPAGYRTAFDQAGGTGALGQPVEAVRPWGTQACIQRFRGGSAGPSALIQYTCQKNLQVFPVTGRLWSTYSSHKDGADRIGYPLGRAHSPYGFGFQLFESPSGDFTAIVDGPVGTFLVRSPVLDAYLEAQHDGDRLGPATSAARVTGDRVVQDFERGRIDLPLGAT